MNKRQSDILKTLYNNRGFLTLSELSEKFEVSVKTIRNDITAIRDFLENQRAGTMESKPHVGVRAVISEEEWSRILEDNGDDREIMFFIIRQLMTKKTLTAQRLSEQYYIGRGQLDKILERVAEWFSENHILLDIRRSKGISISYSEFNYRMAMLKFFSEFWDMYKDIISLRNSLYSEMSDDEYTGLCAALNGFDADIVAKILLEIEEEFGLKFNYISNKNLIFLISLSVLRYKSENQIQMPKAAKRYTDGVSDKYISEEIVQKLNDRLSVNIPDEEKAFIEFAVSISEIHSFNDDECRHRFELMNFELCRMTVRTVNIISEIADVNLREDDLFVKEMFLQIKSMISRLKYGIVFKNELLSQIKLKYSNTMAIAWSLENMFEKELEIRINEHEVGFLALYIGGAIGRKFSGIKACIVCDYGIGTSQILKEKIIRSIPELNITSVFSIRDINLMKKEDCDFIISTASLDSYRLNKDVITVRCLMDSVDLKMIEDQLLKIKKQKKIMFNSIQPTFELFKRDLIFTRCSLTDKTEILKTVCCKLKSMGYVTEQFEKSVLDREKSTATDIGKGIAIPHGCYDYVNHSVVAFISLEKPIKWTEKGEYIDLIFLLAFDMKESDYVKETIIKFYKSIVVFMEDSAFCERLRTIEDKDKILKYLNEERR